jgi:probable rRNA maturation factor
VTSAGRDGADRVIQRAVYLPPWRIDVTVRDGVGVPAPIRRLAAAIAAALEAARAPSPASIGLILGNDHELTELNERHMGALGPTDVLSFPLLPADTFPLDDSFVRPPGRRIHLGDIVVSVERAAEQAASGRGGQTGDVRWSTADELRLLVTHGALHVCGWDHADPAEERAMRALEQRLLGG